jgi:hypothetical protein
MGDQEDADGNGLMIRTYEEPWGAPMMWMMQTTQMRVEAVDLRGIGGRGCETRMPPGEQDGDGGEGRCILNLTKQ